MKQPAIDLRAFRLSKLNTPEYCHFKYLLGWVIYLILFYLTETFIPVGRCHVVHCFLDDLIPFLPVFVIPYVFWYFLIILSLIYFGLYDPAGFRKLMKFIIVTQAGAMLCYVLYPTQQELRPLFFPQTTVFTKLVALIYSLDTNTGVCPSLHVAISIGIASAWLKNKDAGKPWKAFIVLCALLICLSTVFIKQHSAIDFFMALPLCLLAEWVAYGKKARKKRLFRAS